MSAGTVFTDNGGFRLLLGQPSEFPLLQVKFFFILDVNFQKQIKLFQLQSASNNSLTFSFSLQARHIPLAPGKEHIIEVGGTHISTASSSSMWNLDGFIHLSMT